MFVLVTGATGLLGNNICRSLIASGHQVRALVRNPSDRSLAGLPLDCFEGDIRTVPATALARIDAVIHCAGYVHVGNRHRQQLWETNVDGTAHLLAVASGIPFVYVSSIDAMDVNGYPQSPYALSKAAAEAVVKSATWATAIVRPGFMIGPYDWKPSSGRLLIEMAADRLPWVPPGTNLFCDVRDVAAWCIQAIGQSDTFYPGGTCLDYFGLAQLVAEIHGSRPPRRRLRPATMRFVGWCGDVASHFTRTEVELNSVSARCSAALRQPAHLAHSEGPIKNRPLAESIRDALDWFKAERFL